MSKALTTLPIRYCEYRFCLGPQEIPEERRSDALYCCNEHGIMERNARQKDNLILVSDLNLLRKNQKTLDFLYLNGKTKGVKEILDALDFNFKIITEIEEINFETKKIRYRIFEYVLEINGENYTITKKE